MMRYYGVMVLKVLTCYSQVVLHGHRDHGNTIYLFPPELYLAGTLRRSLLEHLPKQPARFLVAPLQSIERGHNILVGEEAAIGSVYFLVRPYPVPGDIHAAINKINTWATDYVPTLTQMNATLAGHHLREAAAER